MTESKKRARRGDVAEAVLKYFAASIGVDNDASTMAADLGYEVNQIQAAVYNLRSKNPRLRNEIEVLLPARVWRYRPQAFDTNGQQPTSEQPVDASPEPPKPPTRTQRASVEPAPAEPTETLSEPPQALFELVGSLDGHPIVQDEDGWLYRIRGLNLHISKFDVLND